MRSIPAFAIDHFEGHSNANSLLCTFDTFVRTAPVARDHPSAGERHRPGRGALTRRCQTLGSRPRPTNESVSCEPRTRLDGSAVGAALHGLANGRSSMAWLYVRTVATELVTVPARTRLSVFVLTCDLLPHEVLPTCPNLRCNLPSRSEPRAGRDFVGGAARHDCQAAPRGGLLVTAAYSGSRQFGTTRGGRAAVR
jgi:hypothetical protein